MGLSLPAINQILQAALTNSAFSVASRYVALFSDVPTRSSSGTELAFGGGYARYGQNPLWPGFPLFTSASGGAVSNLYTIEFTCSSGSWTIAGVGIFDQGSQGTRLWQGYLPDTVVTLNSGDTIQWRNQLVAGMGGYLQFRVQSRGLLSSFARPAQDAILNAIFSGSSWNVSSPRLALFSDLPSETSSGTEYTADADYARKGISSVTHNQSFGEMRNHHRIHWTFSTPRDPAKGFGIFDQVVGGTRIFQAPFYEDLDVKSGMTVSVAPGDLIFSVASVS